MLLSGHHVQEAAHCKQVQGNHKVSHKGNDRHKKLISSISTIPVVYLTPAAGSCAETAWQ